MDQSTLAKTKEKIMKRKMIASAIDSKYGDLYLESVLSKLSSDEELFDFFQKLYQKVHEARAKRGEEYSRYVNDELLVIAENYARERAKIEERLRASGVELSSEGLIGSVEMREFTSRGSDQSTISSIFSSSKPMPAIIEFYEYYKFDGQDVDRDVLLDFNYNRNLEDARYELSKVEELIALNKERIEAIKKKKIMLPSKRRYKLWVHERNIERGEFKKKILEEKIKMLEYILSLSDSQREYLIKYFQATEGIKRASDQIRKLSKIYSQSLPEIDSQEVMLEAIELLKADGMTDEEIDRALDRLDKLTLNKDSKKTNSDGVVFYGDEKILRSFIRHVYGVRGFDELNVEEIKEEKIDEKDISDDEPDIGE